MLKLAGAGPNLKNVPLPDASARIFSLPVRTPGVDPAVLEAVRDVVAFVDAGFRIRYVNQAAERICKLPAERLLGGQIWELFPKIRGTRFEAQLLQSMRERVPSSFDHHGSAGSDLEVRLIPSGDGLLICLTDATQTRRLLAECEAHSKISRDLIAERKEIETRLMVSDRMASVGTLAAGVAHEINNPLAFVLANLDFAVKQLDELAAGGTAESRLAELRSVLGDAREGADRVRAIVRDLKIFSRSDEPKLGPIDLHRVLDSCCNMAWNEIRHRARLEKSYLRGSPRALGTESRLSQVFLNLLVNAAQAIPEGQASHHLIRVTTGALDDGRFQVSISDTGPGMPAEVRARIFEPFFTTKPAGVGTGLGLSIVRGIVEELKGEISVESEPGKGTCFRLLLPGCPS